MIYEFDKRIHLDANILKCTLFFVNYVAMYVAL